MRLIVFCANRDTDRSSIASVKNNIDWIPIENQNVEEEVTIYRTASGAYGDVLSDKDGYSKFKDIIDTSGCYQLFNGKKTIRDIEKIDLNRLNKTQLSMVFKVRSNPLIVGTTVERIHFSTFKDTYDFYEVKNFSDLLKQNGQSWDSLMVERMDFMKKVALSQENYKARQERLVRQRDSLQREYEKWYEANKDSIEDARVKAISFNNTFQLNTLGWFNCDSYYQSELANMSIDIPSSEMYNVTFILKREKMAIKSCIGPNNKVLIQAPKNRVGTLVGMKIVEGEPYLGLLDITSSSSTFDIKYKKVTTDEIKEQFNLLTK